MLRRTEEEEYRKQNLTITIGIIIVFLLFILGTIGLVLSFPKEQDRFRAHWVPEERYQVYAAELIYNYSFSADELLSSLTNLNYTLGISGPYIKIYFNASLRDINATCPEIIGHKLRNSSDLTENIKFHFRIYSHDGNKKIDLQYDLRKTYRESPFTNKSDSKIIIEKFADYIKELIYQYTSKSVYEIRIYEIYEGPIP
ncbi:MAG: hypothetical protein AB1485_06700 [Candidatus Thermoplasmatota archaeon]